MPDDEPRKREDAAGRSGLIGPEALLDRARKAAKRAYVPDSNFHVGAAVVADGKVFTGCNVENASYSLAICAERNAIFHAINAGHTSIDALAVSCVDVKPGDDPDLIMPCGACRQVLAEFASADTPVYVDKVGTFTLGELLPRAFKLKRNNRA